MRKKRLNKILLVGLFIFLVFGSQNAGYAAQAAILDMNSDVTSYSSLNDIKQRVDEQLELKAKRNIFAPKKKQKTLTAVDDLEDSDEVVLRLVKTGFKSLGLNYRGQMFYKDGTLVAQVNYKKKTYLVSKGSKFKGNQVTDLSKEMITIKTYKGKEVTIPFRKIVFTDERIAEIQECNSLKTAVLSMNSKFLGYKVLDISEDSVIVSKHGQHLKLQKGTVHK